MTSTTIAQRRVSQQNFGPLALNRVSFLDHIRVFLTALVILHHSAIEFGASGGWYLKIPTHSLAERILSTIFVSINQAFFMGFFFLLAGYFSVASYDHKGPLRFMRDRIIRLGIPLLIYGYVLGPMTVAMAEVAHGKPFLQTWGGLISSAYFNIGPLWFAFALLLFSAAYAAWRIVAPQAEKITPFIPGHGVLLSAALTTGMLAFLLRLWVPVGQERWMLQVGYFASYIVLFIAGCMTSRSRWLEQINLQLARPWRIAAIVCAPLLFVYGIAAGAAHGAPFNTSGGWTLPALAYSFWEPFVAWGIILSMLCHCRLRLARYSTFSSWSGSAYAAYCLHPPVIVGIALLLVDVALPNSLRFAIVGVGGVLLSFVLARLVLCIPGSKRIL